MPTLTDRDIVRIELEGRFQQIKALTIERKVAPVTAETPATSVISELLRELISEARQHRISDIDRRASAFLLVLEAIRLRTDLAKLRQEFAEAAVLAEGIATAKKIAEDGAAKLIFIEVDKALSKLFDALAVLKKGLDALSALGVSGDDFDKARADLETAIKAAKEKAK